MTNQTLTYTPTPIDTSNIDLPPEVDELIERLSENNHSVWSRGRLEEGWTLGPQRDDAKKQHPCLVPYDRLPESEKEVDRHTATEILKAIVALGFRIEKKAGK
mgnify:FL=1